MRPGSALGIALLVGLSACARVTEVVVTINNVDLEAPTDLRTICIRVTSPADNPSPIYLHSGSPICPPGETANCVGFPISMTLIPGSQRPNDTVRVEVLALPAGEPCNDATPASAAVLSEAAVFTFTDGERQKLDFYLYRQCLKSECPAASVNCGACAAADQTCRSDGTCGALSLVSIDAPADLASPVDIGTLDQSVPNGCPIPQPPAVGPGCTLYQFMNGMPAELMALNMNDITTTYECGMLHLKIPAGTHNFWSVSVDAPRIETKVPSTARYRATTRFHASFNRNEQFAGVYARGGTRYASAHEGFIMDMAYEWWEVFDTVGAGTDAGVDTSRVVYPPSAPSTHTLSIERTSINPDAGISYYNETMTTDLGGLMNQAVSIPANQVIGIEAGNAGMPTSMNAVDIYFEYLLICPQ